MLSRSLTSFSMSLKALPSAARKQTEPVPVGAKAVAACSVIAADGSANSASRFGGTGLVRPSSVSSNPTCDLPPLPSPDRGRPGWPCAAYLLSCCEIFSSAASRFSSEGWVEKMFDRVTWPLVADRAGAK